MLLPIPSAPASACMPGTRPLRVLVADDHPMFRQALLQLLSRVTPIQATEADSFESLKACLALGPGFDLALLDLDMPGTDGFAGLCHLLAQAARVPVVVISGHESPETILRVRTLGARAFIPKSLPLDSLLAALRNVLSGNAWFPTSDNAGIGRRGGDTARSLVGGLTPQQARVLALVAQGLLNKQIAQTLGMKEATVKWHVTAILRRLGLRRRTEAVLLMQKLRP